jgi:two-component system NarL family sensor kinase
VRARALAASPEDVRAEAERVVAWLRVPAVALLALGQGLEHPNPNTTAFVVVLMVFSAWSAGLLAWVYLRPTSSRVALGATCVDIVAISLLAVLSGGPVSHARLAFFLVPVAVAFRFRPAITVVAAAVTTAAYVIQALAHPAGSTEIRFIVVQAGYLAWVGAACVLLSMLLGTRTRLAEELAAERSRLLDDALEAEQRERRALAEGLHDHAIQNLLSVRHALEDVAAELPASPALTRADTALSETIAQLRDAVFDLHPYVLDVAGLPAALRSIANRAAERAGLALRLDLRSDAAHPLQQLAFSAARELLANVVQHANATRLAVALVEDDRELVLTIEDDGDGFPPGVLTEALAAGHVGIASQRFRVEAAGGTFRIASEPGEGTRAEVRLPAASPVP